MTAGELAHNPKVAGSSPAPATKTRYRSAFRRIESPKRTVQRPQGRALWSQAMSEIEQLHRQFCEFSITFKANTPRTIKWLRATFADFLRGTGLTGAAQLDRRTIENWIVHKKLENSWSAKSVRNNLQALSLFCDWLVREALMPENPVSQIPKPKLPHTIRPHLTLDKAEQLLDWTRNFPFGYAFERARAIAIVSTFLHTGIRLEELRNLRCVHVDIVNRSVFVEKGKCQKDRIVPFGLPLVEALIEYSRHRTRLKKNCPYFFTAMRQDSKMGDSVIKRLVVRLREKSGIYFYPHMLRHTYATLMLQGGSDIRAVQELLGHASIHSTLPYLHTTTAHLQAQVHKYPLNAMGGARGC